MKTYVLILLCVSLTQALIQRRGINIKATPLKDIGTRIVNGDEAQPGDLPWQVGIQGLHQDGYGYWCGGSLIGDIWVLTAAHCLLGGVGANIYYNTTVISSANRGLAQAVQFIIHEEYNPSYLSNDIGLIRLNNPVVFNDFTKPISLAKLDPPVGTNVTVSGWGVTSDSDLYTSNILYATTVQIIENTACQQIYGTDVIVDQVVCASPGSPFSSPCQGDSGAPVVVLDSCGKPVQIGVFSFTNGIGCEYAYPSGHSRVAFFLDWIKSNTNN